MGPQPFEFEVVELTDFAGQPDRIIGVCPDAVHPGVEFQMHANPRPTNRCRASGGDNATFGVHRGRYASSDRGADRLGGRLGQQEDRCVDSCVSEQQALFDQRDSEHRRTSAEGPRATTTDPCPYPSAFTTAQSSAGALTSRRSLTLCATAERSTSAHAWR